MSKTLTLKTLQNMILSDTIYRVPLFSELGKSTERMFLIECKFHDEYDGIIGNDILRTYNAIIDYDKNRLVINNRTVPLLFPKFHHVKLVTHVECGLIHIKKHCNSTGEIIAN